MVSEVIKKDGSKEPFDASKIRGAIRSAATGAGLLEERVEELVKEVSDAVIDAIEGKETISTREIRAMILDKLDTAASSVSAAWRIHDAEKE